MAIQRRYLLDEEITKANRRLDAEREAIRRADLRKREKAKAAARQRHILAAYDRFLSKTHH